MTPEALRPCSCGYAVVGAETDHQYAHGIEVTAHLAYPDECHVKEVCR